MISGIAKLYIQLHSNIYSKGFSFGGNRLGFSLKQNINWVEVPIQRDSASDSGSVSNQANSFTVEAKTVNLNLGLLNYNGKRVVCRYITNNNQERIIGVDQAANISVSYSSGEKLGDEQGMIIKIFTHSKMMPEAIPAIVVPSANCFLRADSVELFNGYVKRMIDQSGNGYHGISMDQYTGNPYLINILNGKPVVFVDATSLYIDGYYIGKTALWGGGINASGFNDEYTLLMVVKLLDYPYNQIVSAANLTVLVEPPSHNISVLPRGAGAYFNIADLSNFKVIAIRMPVGGNNAELYIDNVLIGTIPAGTAPQNFVKNKFFIGLSNVSNQMYLAEFRVWDKVLSNKELSAITSEIMTYYAL